MHPCYSVFENMNMIPIIYMLVSVWNPNSLGSCVQERGWLPSKLIVSLIVTHCVMCHGVYLSLKSRHVMLFFRDPLIRSLQKCHSPDTKPVLTWQLAYGGKNEDGFPWRTCSPVSPGKPKSPILPICPMQSENETFIQ